MSEKPKTNAIRLDKLISAPQVKTIRDRYSVVFKGQDFVKNVQVAFNNMTASEISIAITKMSNVLREAKLTWRDIALVPISSLPKS